MQYPSINADVQPTLINYEEHEHLEEVLEEQPILREAPKKKSQACC